MIIDVVDLEKRFDGSFSLFIRVKDMDESSEYCIGKCITMHGVFSL